MHFTTKFSVNIAGKLVETVHSVKAKYDSKHIGGKCDIVVPLNCRIRYANGAHDFLTSYPMNQFKVGDDITITASYPNTQLPDVQVFKGNVFEFKEGTPCTIRCIDYLPLLGHMQNFNAVSITLKALIEKILVGTGITLILPTVDMTLVDITFRTMSPWAILEYLKKSIGLNISLQGTRLYVNVASNSLNIIKYRSDRNIHLCGLQQPDTIWEGYKIKAWFLQPNGVRDSLEVGDKDGHLTEVYFYKVSGGLPVYNKLAAEALLKVRQRKYSGKVGTYLYPDCQLFDKVEYTDIRYPNRSGNYVITAMDITLDDSGFHREMKWAFLTDVLGLTISG